MSRSDNPVGNANPLNRRSFSRAVSDLFPEGGPLFTNAAELTEQDPHAFTTFQSTRGTRIYRSQARKQRLWRMLDKQYAGMSGLRKVFDALGDDFYQHEVLYNRKQHAMFVRLSGGAVMPIPLQQRGQLARGIVHFGTRRRAAYMAHDPALGLRSFSDLYYDRLASSLRKGGDQRIMQYNNTDMIRMHRKILGTTLVKRRGPMERNPIKIGTLLQEGASMLAGGGSYFGTMAVNIGRTLSPFDEARMLARFGVSEMQMALVAGQDDGFKKGRQRYETSMRNMARVLAGSTGHQLLNPKALFDPLTPELMLADDSIGLFGALSSSGQLSKHQHYERRVAAMTPDTFGRLSAAGVRPIPYTASTATLAAAQSNPLVLTRYRTVKAAVLSFGTVGDERRILGDSGGLLLRHGASRMRTKALVRNIDLRATEENLRDIERLFNIPMGEFQRRQKVSAKLPFSVVRGIELLHGAKPTGAAEESFLYLARGPRMQNLWSAVLQDSELTDLEFEGNRVRLKFHTQKAVMGSHTSVVVGGRRATLTRVPKRHVLSSLHASRAEIAVAASEVAKGLPAKHLIENFFGRVLEDRRYREIAQNVPGVQLRTHQMVVDGHRWQGQVAEIQDEAKAFASVQDILANLKNTDRHMFDTIVHGAAMSAPGTAGVTGVREQLLMLGRRADEHTDLHQSRRVGITAGKMKTLLHRGGTSIQLLYKGWSQATGFRIHPATGALIYPQQIKDFFRGTVGGVTPRSGMILRATGSAWETGEGRALKALPELVRGSVPFKDLKDTPFRLGGTRFLDLGRAVDFNLYPRRKGPVRKQTLRYLPINLDLIGASRADPDRNLRLSKSHLGRPLYDLLHTIQQYGIELLDPQAEAQLAQRHGLSPEHIGKLRTGLLAGMQSHLEQVIDAAVGKPHGLLSRASMARMPGAAVRLLPAGVDGGDFLDTWMSRTQFEEVFRSRLTAGDWRTTLSELDRQGYVDALIGVDPMQRPEHAMPVRLRMSPTAARGLHTGRGGISLSPFMMWLFKRDHDMDKANVILLSSLKDADPNLAGVLESERAGVIQRMQPDLAVYQVEHSQKQATLSEMMDKFLSGSIDPRLLTEEQILEHLKLASGQAHLASFGYTIFRSTRGLADVLGTRSSDEFRQVLRNLGATRTNLLDDQIDAIRAIFGDAATDEITHARALSQSMMQAGVGKAKSKEALLGLAEDITHIRSLTKVTDKADGIGLQESISRSTEAFHRFFGSFDQWTEMELHGVLPRLLREGPVDFSDPASRSILAERAARLLGGVYGAAIYLHGQSKVALSDSFVPLETPTMDEAARERKVLRPILGERLDDVTARQMTIGAPPTRAAQAAKQRQAGGRWTLLGIGAAIGGGIAAMMSGQDLEPPEPMVSPLSDRFQDRPIHIGPEQAPAPARMFGRRGHAPVSSLGGASHGSLILRDERQSISPYMIERQIRSISDSDFTY